MLKLGSTLPNLANQTMKKLYPFCKNDKDFRENFREDMTGGPFYVFPQKTVMDETLIRNSSNICKSIGGTVASQFTPNQCDKICHQDCTQDKILIPKLKTLRPDITNLAIMRTCSCCFTKKQTRLQN